MNKRIFGIKIKTILQMILCVLVAVSIWLFVKFANTIDFDVEGVAYAPFETVETDSRL